MPPRLKLPVAVMPGLFAKPGGRPSAGHGLQCRRELKKKSSRKVVTRENYLALHSREEGETTDEKTGVKTPKKPSCSAP